NVLRYQYCLTLRPPPTSTLFPYTTLFRSGVLEQRRERRQGAVGADEGQFRQLQEGVRRAREQGHPIRVGQGSCAGHHGAGDAGRSEEHTSELQSHLNLVCRLLLEKKKKNT